VEISADRVVTLRQDNVVTSLKKRAIGFCICDPPVLWLENGEVLCIKRSALGGICVDSLDKNFSQLFRGDVWRQTMLSDSLMEMTFINDQCVALKSYEDDCLSFVATRSSARNTQFETWYNVRTKHIEYLFDSGQGELGALVRQTDGSHVMTKIALDAGNPVVAEHLKVFSKAELLGAFIIPSQCHKPFVFMRLRNRSFAKLHLFTSYIKRL